MKEIMEKLIKSVVDTKKEAINYTDVAREYELVNRDVKKMILQVTSGRSGMRWLRSILCAHENYTGSGDEKNAIPGAFYRYIKWNDLPIDVTGVLDVIKKQILLDWEKVENSVLGGPFFIIDLLNICEELKPDKLIWGISDPRFTVTSFYNKGWYLEENIRGDKNLVNGYQPAMEQWHHFSAGWFLKVNSMMNGSLCRVSVK